MEKGSMIGIFKCGLKKSFSSLKMLWLGQFIRRYLLGLLLGSCCQYGLAYNLKFPPNYLFLSPSQNVLGKI